MEREEIRLIPSTKSRVHRQPRQKSPQASSELVAPLLEGIISSTSQSSLVQTNQVVKPKPEIVPMDLHHPILREFPEHRDVIRRLKGASDHFRSVFDEYHRLDD